MRVAAALVLLTACASAAPPAVAPAPVALASAEPAASAAPEPPSTEYVDQLALARAARDKAAASPAPKLARAQTIAESERFLADKLAPWVKEQLPLLRDAEEHYGRAFQAGTPSQKVDAASEYLTMLAGVIDAIAALPIPAQAEGDPEFAKTMTETLAGVTAPFRARGRVIAAKCVEASRKAEPVNPKWSVCSDFPAKYPP